MLVPSWSHEAPLLAAALLVPLGGGRALLPLTAVPLTAVGVPAAGMAVVAALLLTDDQPLPTRLLALGLALAAGACGTVANGGLPTLTPVLLMAGVGMGVIGSFVALIVPGSLGALVAATAVSLPPALLWGWAPLPFPPFNRIAEGIVVAGGLALAAYTLGKLNRAGLAAGAVIGGTIFALLGWEGFSLMTLFVVMGIGFTQKGHRDHAAHEIRGAPHVVANIGPAFLFALIGWTTNDTIWLIPFAGALAAATADTLSAELGRRFGPTPVDLFTAQPLPAGTDGAVSIAGTIFGATGALVIALAGWGFGYYTGLAVVAVTLGGMAGSLADSALGSLYERQGMLGNHQVNFLGASSGGLVALVAGLVA